MQLVAASKMKTFQRSSLAVKAYTEALEKSLALCGATLAETDFGKPRAEGKTLFVLMTSDKGLCGAMNARLIRTLAKNDLWNALGKDERLLLTVGKKSGEFARVNKIPTIGSFAGLKEQMTTFEALEVIHAILEAWESGEVKEVILIAPSYVNPFVFHTNARTYLPLGSRAHAELEEAAFFEPGIEEATKKIANQMIEGIFLQAFYELKATEYSSRMVAMKKATEAADDRVTTLTIELNKARQSAITSQLSELASANEAMSSQNTYETFEV